MNRLLILSALAALVAADYNCDVINEGTRYHEGSSPTPYDCVDEGCGNSCLGGQCVAYVVCSCRSRSTGNYPGGTNCWTWGRKVAPNGICDSSIPANTAVATFNNGVYNGHAGVFLGCASDSVIRIWDQWCCSAVGETYYAPTLWHYDDYYVLELAPGCSDRPSVSCRIEAAGPTCCPTYVDGCAKAQHWADGVYDMYN